MYLIEIFTRDKSNIFDGIENIEKINSECIKSVFGTMRNVRVTDCGVRANMVYILVNVINRDNVCKLSYTEVKPEQIIAKSVQRYKIMMSEQLGLSDLWQVRFYKRIIQDMKEYNKIKEP